MAGFKRNCPVFDAFKYVAKDSRLAANVLKRGDQADNITRL
jgi:hypothetical protein